jgi:hypothetical protein
MQMKITFGVKKEKRNNKMQMSCFDYSEYTRQSTSHQDMQRRKLVC